MHYFAAVLVPVGTEDIDEAVGAAMEPFNEETAAEDQGRWDWWQIGGRYTGRWSDYNPATDPANHESCRLCDGTGYRNDPVGVAHRERNPEYTCNGCGFGDHPGNGVALKWPTQWVRYPGDVVRVAHLLDTEAATPYALLTPDGWSERETWTGGEFVETPDWDKAYRVALEQYRDTHLAVVVDYHN